MLEIGGFIAKVSCFPVSSPPISGSGVVVVSYKQKKYIYISEFSGEWTVNLH